MDNRLELGETLMIGIGLTGPNYENVPVNSCPDDDPVGEPRPMKCVPVNDLGPLADYILESGWLAQVKADAWDEGHNHCFHVENPNNPIKGNPYRKE